MKKKIDLRFNDYREAIVEVGNALNNCPLTDRALALLIADSSKITITQALAVLKILPELSKRYLKNKEGSK
jgi:uncharacterized protein HemY